jgi:hypothetical protein
MALAGSHSWHHSCHSTRCPQFPCLPWWMLRWYLFWIEERGLRPRSRQASSRGLCFLLRVLLEETSVSLEDMRDFGGAAQANRNNVGLRLTRPPIDN